MLLGKGSNTADTDDFSSVAISSAHRKTSVRNYRRALHPVGHVTLTYGLSRNIRPSLPRDPLRLGAPPKGDPDAVALTQDAGDGAAPHFAQPTAALLLVLDARASFRIGDVPEQIDMDVLCCLAFFRDRDTGSSLVPLGADILIVEE